MLRRALLLWSQRLKWEQWRETFSLSRRRSAGDVGEPPSPSPLIHPGSSPGQRPTLHLLSVTSDPRVWVSASLCGQCLSLRKLPETMEIRLDSIPFGSSKQWLSDEAELHTLENI